MGSRSSSGLQEALDELAGVHGVPGATLAVLDEGHVTEVATGVINKATGVETTPDTLFQVGSIAKAYTASLVMQLVDAAAINLDRPVRAYLPELEVGDADAGQTITMRQLLSHSSGLDGDFLEDTGRGDDCVERYVAGCATLPQIARPGRVFSYSGAGFVIAGRVVETLTGGTWDTALEQRLLRPLRTQRTTTFADDAIRHRVAVGHVDQHGAGDLTPSPVWGLPRSLGPAGGTLLSTAAEVVSFVEPHLAGGITRRGVRLLSDESVSAMQEPQIAVPDASIANAWGLGWMLFDWDGSRVFGHNGTTIGQQAFLRAVPEAGFAACLLTNGWHGWLSTDLSADLFRWLFAERLKIHIPVSPKPDGSATVESSLYAGMYENIGLRTVVEVVEGELVASLDYGNMPTAGFIDHEHRQIALRALDRGRFLLARPAGEGFVPVTFFDFDNSGRPQYVHIEGRASRRVECA